MNAPVRRNSRRTPNTPPSGRERGAVLIVAMILLVVLTLLGVSAMNTSQLEERMASNSQESARAFESAETGLSMAFASDTAWTLDGLAGPKASIPSTVAGLEAQWSSAFAGWSPPPPGSLFSATKFRSANFDFTSVGSSGNGNIATTVHGGAFQIAPNSN